MWTQTQQLRSLPSHFQLRTAGNSPRVCSQGEPSDDDDVSPLASPPAPASPAGDAGAPATPKLRCTSWASTVGQCLERWGSARSQRASAGVAGAEELSANDDPRRHTTPTDRLGDGLYTHGGAVGSAAAMSCAVDDAPSEDDDDADISAALWSDVSFPRMQRSFSMLKRITSVGNLMEAGGEESADAL